MAKLKLVALALCISMLMPVVAAATVLFTPDWDGEDGSTFQEWSFDDDDNPAVPEVISNPYGGAEATITVGVGSPGWVESGFPPLTGYWDLSGEGGQIVLDIDNRPESLPYKEIWVQVTYDLWFYEPPTVDVPGAVYLEGETAVVVGDWYLDLSKWRIEPNPAREQIILTAGPTYGSLIDQIAVHTICVPEPTTIALLGLGSLSLLRRKRRA